MSDNALEQLKRRVAELESENAHLVGAMRDQWLMMQRARHLRAQLGDQVEVIPLAPLTVR